MNIDLKKNSQIWRMFGLFFDLNKLINGDKEGKRTEEYWEDLINASSAFYRAFGTLYALELGLAFLDEVERRSKKEKRENREIVQQEDFKNGKYKQMLVVFWGFQEKLNVPKNDIFWMKFDFKKNEFISQFAEYDKYAEKLMDILLKEKNIIEEASKII